MYGLTDVRTTVRADAMADGDARAARNTGHGPDRRAETRLARLPERPSDDDIEFRCVRRRRHI